MSINTADALEYYDKNNELYSKLKRKIRYVQPVKQKKTDVDGIYLAFYDKNKEKLFTSRVEIVGKYYTTHNVWIWGWAIPSAKYAAVTIIRNLLFYGTGMNIENKNELVVLKNELVSSRLRITDNIQLDIHCAMASYLAKQKMIYEIDDFPNINFDGDIGELTEISSTFFKETSDKDVATQLFLFIVTPPDV